MHSQFKPNKKTVSLKNDFGEEVKLLTLYFYYILTLEYTSTVLCNEMGNKVILQHAKVYSCFQEKQLFDCLSSALNTLFSWNPIVIERTIDRGTRAIQT